MPKSEIERAKKREKTRRYRRNRRARWAEEKVRKARLRAERLAVGNADFSLEIPEPPPSDQEEPEILLKRVFPDQTPEPPGVVPLPADYRLPTGALVNRVNPETPDPSPTPSLHEYSRVTLL